MKCFSFLMLAPLIAGLVSCDEAKTNPVETTEAGWHSIADPGRGFYRHTERKSAADAAPSVETMKKWRADGTTLVMRVFYLGEFTRSDIAEEYLKAIGDDFSAIREAGMKSIVRFAYSPSMDAPEEHQAGEELVVRHISQIAPVLAADSDVLHCVQAGFLGAWGEWHSVHPDFRESDGSLAPEPCRRIIHTLLAAVPEPVFLQVRTPRQKWMLFESGARGFDRVGQHNDCFLASPDDVGTYGDPDGEKLWLETETESLPMGGETCGVSLPRSSGESALRELARFHYNYLNADYHPAVLDSWKNDGTYQEIAARLGHRICLSGAMESDAGLRLTLRNDGFAAPLYERTMEYRKPGGKTLTADGFTARSLEPGAETTIILPGVSPPVEIRFPDPHPRLKERADYALRLANPGVPIDSAGWQILQTTSP